MDLLSLLPPESPGSHLASGLEPFLVCIPLATTAASASSKQDLILDPGVLAEVWMIPLLPRALMSEFLLGILLN